MKPRINHLRLVALLVVVTLGAARAATWNPLNWFKPKRIQTLVICGNVAQQRLLAEVAQRETRDTFLMLAPEAGGDLYLMTPDFTATTAGANQVAEVVRIIGPRRVIIIGDSFYFPQAAADQLNGLYPVIQIKGDDWRKNADAMGQGMGLPELPKLFDEKLLDLESKLALPEPVQPLSTPATATPLPPLPAPRAASSEGTVKVLDRRPAP